jgi:hypothetical protein
VDPDPDGGFYRVPNYVPDVHASKVAAWVAAETTAGRYTPSTRGFRQRLCSSWCRGQRPLGHGQTASHTRSFPAYRYQHQPGNLY